MKQWIKLIMLATLIMIAAAGKAQVNMKKVLERTTKKTEKSIENRIEKRVNKGVDKTLDETEKGIDEAVKGDGTDEKKDGNSSEDKDKERKSDSKSNDKQADDKSKPVTDEAWTPQEAEKPKPVLEWAKYDFVPGAEIIFEDNQEGEQNGEFPSKWDLVSGSVENANFDGQNVIYFIKCNANGGGNIVPLLKNSAEDYLPEEFTIEFDAFFGEKSSNYYVFLADDKNQQKLDKSMRADDKWLRFSKNGGEHEQDIERKFYPGFSGAKSDITSKWRHISISFNTRALKGYMDDTRIINIPNLGYNPTGVGLAYHNPGGGTNVGYIKNIRIAKGAVPLYDKVLTDGKFVTTGIKFDVNKATIKAESMGTINYVVKMMQDNPTLKFSVEGHTDSDGDDASNQKLSEARAKAIMDRLVELGIGKDRLTSKGHGESKPMAANDTPEGKAQNRRVEFVKF